ncbi:MAG TPA: hypothetical protein VFD84_19370 [Candidatus Binatia bacterium]|nr:hypothetical protein [Candidatus Binatia bacterium]
MTRGAGHAVLRRSALLVALLVAGARTARALGDYRIDGDVAGGYRFVDVDGSEKKYREDYDLRQGVRLFDLNVDGVSQTPDTTPLDRFHLEVDTPGDEPYSLFRLAAADRRLWDLRVDFTRSKYVYDVPQLFETPVPGDLRTGDLHQWNFVRTNGAVDLTVRAPHLPTLLFGYRLYERDGASVSTLHLPAGDTFLVHAPIDDVTHAGKVGADFMLLDTSVFVQQEYRRVDRSLARRGPIDPAGVDPTDASTLGSFHATGDEHLDIPTTVVRLRRALGDAAEVTGAYLYSHADLGTDVRRRTVGAPTAVFPGTTVSRDGADATMTTHVADVGGSVRVLDRVRLHLDYRFDERSLDGRLDETSTFGVLAADTGNHLRRHEVSSDVEWEPLDTLTLRGGARWSRRDANTSQSGQTIATDTVGAIGSVRWRPWRFLDAYARYENVQVDDPFLVPGATTAAASIPEREIVLTFVNRATAGLRLTPREWLAVSYQLTADSRENASFDARTQDFGNTFAVTVEPRPGLLFFLTYSRRDLGSRADIRIAPLYDRTTSLQEGTEDILGSELRWDFRLLGQAWSAGGDFSFVNATNALRPRLETTPGARSSFDLNRIDGAAFLTWHHPVVEPSVEIRRIEYDERVLARNDYAATIVAIKLTKRFGW